MLRAGWSEPEDMEVLERFGRLVERSGVRGSVRPVSYTHLDVYKRQILTRAHPYLKRVDTHRP